MNQMLKSDTTLLISETTMALLEELSEEAQVFQELIARLRNRSLSVAEAEDLLVKLTGSISHLRVHAAGLEDRVTEALELLPES